MDNTVRNSYHRGIAASFAAAVALWCVNRYALASASPGVIAAGLIAVLIMFTPLELRDPSYRPHGAAWLLAYAATVMGACFGTSVATDNGLYLFAGFVLGIGYGVYALTKNIDEHVTPSRIFIMTMLQAVGAFFLASS